MSLDAAKLNAWVHQDPEMPVTRNQLSMVFQAVLDLENLTDVLCDRLAVLAMFAMGPSEPTGEVDLKAHARRILQRQAHREFAEATVVSLCRIYEDDHKHAGRLAGVAKMFGINTSGPSVEEMVAQAEKNRKGGQDDG